MITDELKCFIRQCVTNDCFDFSENSLNNILKDANTWRNHWLIIFKQIIRRIKKGHGTMDHSNENGKCVYLPIETDKYMAVFFKNLENKRYLIYDFKIDKLEKI